MSYIPHLLDLTAAGLVDPSRVLTQETGLSTSAIEAYVLFDRREAGWIKTVLDPATTGDGGVVTQQAR